MGKKAYGKMNWMGVKTDRLAISVVMRGEGALHVLQCGRIVDGGRPVSGIPNDPESWSGLFGEDFETGTHNQGSIRCTPASPLLSKKAYIGISQNPGNFGSPLHILSTARQSFAIPLSRVYGQ